MKRMFLTVCLLMAVIAVNAQDVYNSSGRKVAQKPVKKEGFSIDDMIFGGDFRLSVGSGFFSAGIAPMVGVRFTERLSAGVRLGYSFNRIKYDYAHLPSGVSSNIFKFNSYSGGIWGRYIFYQNFYAHVEAEYNIYDIYESDFNNLPVRTTKEAPSILLGIGIKQPVSDRTSFNLTLIYDVLSDPYSYYHFNYNSGFDMRAGILVGF